MTRLLIASAALVLAGVIAEAGVAPPVPRLPSAALKSLKGDEPPGEPQSPEEIAERIRQNTKAAADRLAERDPGEGTQKSQHQALKDLDELLKQAQNPMGGEGGGQSQQKDDMSQQGEQQSKSGSSPMGWPVQGRRHEAAVRRVRPTVEEAGLARPPRPEPGRPRAEATGHR